MIEYRRFLNSDPPALARLWNNLPPLAGRLPGLNARLLDETVLARLYFDPEALIVALRDGQVVGFAHGGFAPAADRQGLDRSRGCLSALVMDPAENAMGADERDEVTRQLLERVERRLGSQGAATVVAGGPEAADPFYLGLLGGSRCEGWPVEDAASIAAFQSAGYVEQSRRIVWRKSLRGFRPPMDRGNLQWQRAALVERRTEQAANSWWDACTFAQHERNHFHLTLRPPAKRSAEVVFWDVQPLSDATGQRTAGLLNWSSDAQAMTDGLLRFLVCDALRRMLDYGVTEVEAQLAMDETSMGEVLRTLDFRPVSEKLLLVKSL